MISQLYFSACIKVIRHLTKIIIFQIQKCMYTHVYETGNYILDISLTIYAFLVLQIIMNHIKDIYQFAFQPNYRRAILLYL